MDLIETSHIIMLLMQAGTDLASSKQLLTFPDDSPVIYTHSYNQLVIRFSHEEIHIIKIVEGLIRTEVFLNRTEMLKELQRAFRAVEGYRMEAVFGSKNIIHVLFSVGEQHYMGTIILSNIVLEYSRVFESSFSLFENQKIKPMLRMEKLGYRVISESRARKAEGVILVARTVSRNSIYLFIIFKGQQTGTCKGKAFQSDLSQVQEMSAYFYEEECSIVLLSNMGSSLLQYSLKEDMTLDQFQIRPIDLPKSPILFSASSTQAVVFKPKDMKSNTGEYYVLKIKEQGSFLKNAQGSYALNNEKQALKILWDNQDQLIFVCYSRSQANYYKMNKNNSQIESQSHSFSKQLKDIFSIENSHVVLFFQKWYEIVSVEKIYLQSKGSLSRASLPNSYNHHSLTYSASSDTRTDKSEKPLPLRYTKLSSNKTPNALDSPQGTAMAATSPVHESPTYTFPARDPPSFPSLASCNDKHLGIQQQKQSLCKVRNYESFSRPEEERVPQLQRGTKLNRHITQPEIAEVRSEDEDSSPKTSVSQLWSHTRPLNDSGRQSHIPGASLPQKEGHAQSTYMVSEFPSFNPATIKESNPSKAPEQIISFGIQDIAKFNTGNSRNRSTELSSTEEPDLPGKPQRTFSFGKDSMAPRLHRQKQQQNESSQIQRSLLRAPDRKGRPYNQEVKSEITSMAGHMRQKIRQFSTIVKDLQLSILDFPLHRLRHVRSISKNIRDIYCSFKGPLSSQHSLGKKKPSQQQLRQVIEEQNEVLDQSIEGQLESVKHYCGSVLRQLTARHITANQVSNDSSTAETKPISQRLWDKSIKVKLSIYNIQQEIVLLKEQLGRCRTTVVPKNKLPRKYSDHFAQEDFYLTQEDNRSASYSSVHQEDNKEGGNCSGGFRQILSKSHLVREVFLQQSLPPLLDLGFDFN